MPRRPRDEENNSLNLDDMDGFHDVEDLDEEQFDPDGDLDEIREIDFEDPNFLRGGELWYGEDLDDND
jgi:hypothetical protein